MKRSEIIKYIEDELKDIIRDRDSHNPKDHTFFTRKADGMLAMLEGFGMLPPEIDSGVYNRSDCNNYYVSEWDNEDEGGDDA